MFGRIGSSEVLLIFGLVLIIFGPRKLPEIGRTMGKGLREFRQAVNDVRETVIVDDSKENKTD